MRHNGSQMVGFTCGAMDLLHAGHILMLKEASEQCDWLIVGLHTDPTIDRPEKNSPIQSLEERRIQLEGCRYVDEIQEYDTEAELLEMLDEYMEFHGKKFVRIIGADWRGKKYTGCDLPIQTIFNSRNHNYSSTELRQRIIDFKGCKTVNEMIK